MTENSTSKPYIVIPSLEPDKRLVPYCKELQAAGLDQIIVVDDGSGPDYAHIFDELKSFCTVLTNETNKGKGHALKRAFAYLIGKDPEANVITCDSDGQHLAKDVIKVAGELAKSEADLVLGSRDFAHSDVPKKSLIGNTITTFIYRVLIGKGVTDTQTGLRGISSRVLSSYTKLPGMRYDYEMSMLIKSTRLHYKIVEIPIEVIYEENNAGTHYRPIRDALLVFKIIIGRKPYLKKSPKS